ncbi:MAG: branched chain amino acid aminotransferase, partial [Spirochaetia bacterium]|nr:branched chain amino acid aminotransferase [Spirochaetia bacterium]
MGKKNLDWGNLPFGYMKTSKSFVATYKNGKWDEGKLVTDTMLLVSEASTA